MKKALHLELPTGLHISLHVNILKDVSVFHED